MQNLYQLTCALILPLISAAVMVMSLFLTVDVSAQVAFTSQEIAQNQAASERISQVAAQCVDGYHDEQVGFFNIWKMTKFYGNRRPDYATAAGRIRAMENYGVSSEVASQIASQQKSTACVTMAMDCLGKGFAAVGMTSTWQKIYAQLAKDNNFEGTDLQKDLHLLGWKIYYWNADPSLNEVWDEQDRLLNPLTPGRKWMPVWGGHAALYREVMKHGTYYGVPVDNAQELVGFGVNPPQAFTKVPFFVGTAHAGYHVFPGHAGRVIEAHSTREINSIDNIQISIFNPLAPGGGPRWTTHEHYRSGIIVVPPGY
jgi:hypothetical protein